MRNLEEAEGDPPMIMTCFLPSLPFPLASTIADDSDSGTLIRSDHPSNVTEVERDAKRVEDEEDPWSEKLLAKQADRVKVLTIQF